jgi:nucleoside-diphosphate-sugar epimerase
MNGPILITGGSGFIGTHLISLLKNYGHTGIVNLDVAPPKKPDHRGYWLECDIMNREALQDAFARSRPAHMIHLAARTDPNGRSLQDYAANFEGTANVAAAVKRTVSIQSAIFTSTQYVVGPGYLPKDDQDFRPHTIYGESKVRSEKAVRDANLSCTWTIVRPTNVWGSWHPRYAQEFWRVLKKGLYFHPGREPVKRSYAYVGNVVRQMQRILESPPELVAGKVFYVGDRSIDLLDWVNAFSLELRGRKVRVVPRPLVRLLAAVGDAVIVMGGRFPLFSSRYRSMTEHYTTPMEPTFAALGEPPIPWHQGVRETVAWLRTQGTFWD